MEFSDLAFGEFPMSGCASCHIKFRLFRLITRNRQREDIRQSRDRSINDKPDASRERPIGICSFITKVTVISERESYEISRGNHKLREHDRLVRVDIYDTLIKNCVNKCRMFFHSVLRDGFFWVKPWVSSLHLRMETKIQNLTFYPKY